MSNNSLISVIVPIYKVEKYLNECIRSIINQTYHNLEIILVDDGSPDKCPEMCDDWAKKDGRIRVIHKENGGLSSARNAGLDICTGEYISFIDSDDWIDPYFYEVLLSEITKSESDIVMCAIIAEYSNGQRDKIPGLDEDCIFSQEDLLHNFLYHQKHLCGGVVDKLYRKEIFKNVRFPIGLNSEDRYVHAVTYSSINKFRYVNTVLYHYRKRENSICTTKQISSHTFDQIKTCKMACDYLCDQKKATEVECTYFMMIAHHDVLRNLVLCKASPDLIRKYTHELRTYYWSTIRDKNVSIGFKCKLTLFCIAPRTYEKVKQTIRKR